MFKNCERCFKEFEATTYNKKYCSNICYNTSKRKRNRKRHEIDVSCDFCKNVFKSYGNNVKYCSNTCSSKATGPKRRKFLDIPQCLDSASRKLDKNLGYVRVYAPMHVEDNTWGYVYEHRVIAEQIVGRSLQKDEIVHHKNGKRWDNRSENLEVMNKHDHAKLHGQRKEDINI